MTPAMTATPAKGRKIAAVFASIAATSLPIRRVAGSRARSVPPGITAQMTVAILVILRRGTRIVLAFASQLTRCLRRLVGTVGREVVTPKVCRPAGIRRFACINRGVMGLSTVRALVLAAVGALGLSIRGVRPDRPVWIIRTHMLPVRGGWRLIVPGFVRRRRGVKLGGGKGAEGVKDGYAWQWA